MGRWCAGQTRVEAHQLPLHSSVWHHNPWQLRGLSWDANSGMVNTGTERRKLRRKGDACGALVRG